MNNKFLLRLLFACMLLYNCKKSTSDKQTKSETSSIVKNIDSNLNIITDKKENSIVIDTTNYVTDCFYDDLIGGEQSFRAIEKYLLENNILIKAEPEGYKDFFIKHVFSLQFGLFINRNSLKVDKQFFQQKLQIANILKTHIKASEENFEVLDSCYQVQAKKKGFKNSSINQLILKTREITDQMVDGTLDIKYINETSKLLNEHFSTELFRNTDSRVLSYIQLSKALKEYDEEQMNSEYSLALEGLEKFKQSKNK